MASLASVEAGDLALNFRGRLIVAEAATRPPASSTSRPRTARASPRSPGWRRRCGSTACPSPARSSFAVDSNKSRSTGWRSTSPAATSKASSRSPIVGERRRVEARLDVDELSVARMLALLQDQRLAVAAVAETAISGRQSVWSDEPFDAAVLDGFEGNIRLNSQAPPAGRRHRPRPGQHRHRAQGRQDGGEADRRRVPRRALQRDADASPRRRPAWSVSGSLSVSGRPLCKLLPAWRRQAPRQRHDQRRDQVLRQGHEPAQRAVRCCKAAARWSSATPSSARCGRAPSPRRWRRRSRPDPDSLRRDPQADARRRISPAASCRFRARSARDRRRAARAPSRSRSTRPRAARRARRASISRRSTSSPIGGSTRSRRPVRPTSRPCRASR